MNLQITNITYAQQQLTRTVGVTQKFLFPLRCTKNGTKNGEKTVTKMVSEPLAKRYFNGAKTVNEKQKPHKFCAISPAVQILYVYTLQHS